MLSQTQKGAGETRMCPRHPDGQPIVEEALRVTPGDSRLLSLAARLATREWRG